MPKFYWEIQFCITSCKLLIFQAGLCHNSPALFILGAKWLCIHFFFCLLQHVHRQTSSGAHACVLLPNLFFIHQYLSIKLLCHQFPPNVFRYLTGHLFENCGAHKPPPHLLHLVLTQCWAPGQAAAVYLFSDDVQRPDMCRRCVCVWEWVSEWVSEREKRQDHFCYVW